MDKLFISVCGLLMFLSAYSAQNIQYAFQNPDLPIDERVDDLVGQLTLDEKILQMINNAPAIERLGIPA
ncbi:MAG: hypothetical protein LBU37_02010, partial [Tannerellaceae bacterium]|nr:hypothetical protein [Tannerellaceae bacterium]